MGLSNGPPGARDGVWEWSFFVNLVTNRRVLNILSHPLDIGCNLAGSPGSRVNIRGTGSQIFGHYTVTRGRVKTLVEDEELKRLRAMAEGSRRFEESGLWERLSALDLKEIHKLPPRERLGVGYYTAARRRSESLKEVA